MTEAAPDFGGRARQAITWTAGFQIFRDVLQFGLMLVLVRLLPPEVYGQFGFVTALLGFLTLYSFREFLGHTLVVRDPGEVHYQDHFTAGVVLQLGIFALANLVAVALRWFPEYAQVAPALHVMSVLFLLDLPSELRVKMLERALDWRRLRGLHGVALVAGGALSIAMALRGWGVYALLVPTLSVPLVFAYDLLVRERWRPTWAWDWHRFTPAWRFGASRISAVSFSSASGVLEAAWLGALGFAAFGIFGRAIGLGQLLCGRVAGLLAQAVFPVLARIPPHSDSYRRASALYLRGVTWLVAPLALTAALLAEPVVGLLYGRQWTEVVPLLPWAMAGAALGAVVQTGYTLLLAHQKQKACMIADVWRLAGTTMALAVLAGMGMKAYLIGLVGVHGVSLTLVLYWLQADRALSAASIGEALVPAVVGSAAAGLVAGEVGRLVAPAGLTLAVAGLVAATLACVYLVILRAVFRRPLMELVQQLPERRRIGRFLRLEGVV